jgi:hypothetical protein
MGASYTLHPSIRTPMKVSISQFRRDRRARPPCLLLLNQQTEMEARCQNHAGHSNCSSTTHRACPRCRRVLDPLRDTFRTPPRRKRVPHPWIST